jgi:chromosome partitioning protein
MMDLELNLVNQVSRENRLKKAIKNSPILKTYDFILIDNPPQVGLTVLNSLTASDFYLVPVSTSYLSLNGIKLLMGVIKQVKEDLNSELKNLGYILTMVDKRKSISSDVEKILRESFEKEVFTNFIRVNTKLESCPFERKTIFEMEKINDKGHLDFLNASKELIERSSWL